MNTLGVPQSHDQPREKTQKRLGQILKREGQQYRGIFKKGDRKPLPTISFRLKLFFIFMDFLPSFFNL